MMPKIGSGDGNSALLDGVIFDGLELHSVEGIIGDAEAASISRGVNSVVIDCNCGDVCATILVEEGVVSEYSDGGDEEEVTTGELEDVAEDELRDVFDFATEGVLEFGVNAS
jgi:hypothetical protein